MQNQNSPRPDNSFRLALGIAIVVIAYGIAGLFGWPQRATEKIVAQHATEVAHVIEKAAPPPIWAVIPFGLLLGAIAVLPLWHVSHHWWESNRNRGIVAGSLGILTLAYYAFLHQAPLEQHFLGHHEVAREAGAISWGFVATILQNALLVEYLPFIVLLFSLYTIYGGIRISGNLPAHPLTNTIFLAVGGLLASLIGTTGAAMLLIRPLIETNAERKHVRHTIVFFIFVVCNCGGCLLPIGDPPLFLGYLEGVDFLWTLSLWQEFLFVNASLLVIYYVWDHFLAYPQESLRSLAADERQITKLTISGFWPNGPLLMLVVLAVALLDPSKPFPGTHWHAWLWLREIVQLALVGFSLMLGSATARQANRFNYTAIVEVAVIFLGIFVCMQPALQILDVYGASMGVDTPTKFFWVTGSISAVLDNAPTYLVFFKTAQTLGGEGTLQAGVPVAFLQAISLGAVFMGAMTYIGNGPNFMVKAIAEESGIKMPTFFGYIAYSVFVLLPILVLMQWLFVS